MKSAAQKNAQISESMSLFARDKFSEDSEQMDVTRAGRSYFKITRKNAAAIAARIKSAHRTFPAGAYKRAGGGREYPRFFAGMTTVEYIVKFQSLNNDIGAHVLPIDYDRIGTRHAATYENGALDFDVIEEPSEDYFADAATQDVAQLVAHAVASAAIAEAMAPAEDARELVTCEAGESESQGMSVGAASAVRADESGSSGGFTPSAPMPRPMEFLGDATPTVAGFLEALADADAAWESGKATAQAMEKFPRGAMGLILDSAKSTPEYQAAKALEVDSIARIKAANTYLLKNFKAEYLAHRAKQRAAKQASAEQIQDYATDGKCHNAQIGTYGHECGKPAQWIGTTSTGFKSGFCSDCKETGNEARTVQHWAPIAPTPPSVESQPTTPSAEFLDEAPAKHNNSEGERIRAAADKMRAQFPDIAAKYDDLATAHDLKDERESRQDAPTVTQAGECSPSQTVKGKSGKWEAVLSMERGLFLMIFDSREYRYETSYPTARDRMESLQSLARAADAPDDTQPTGGLPDAAPAAPMAPVAQFTPTPGVAVSSDTPRHPRSFVPVGGVHIADDAFEAWTYQVGEKHCLVMYLGKSSKKWKHFHYATAAKRDEAIERHATEAMALAAGKAKRKADTREAMDKPHGLQVGDVVRSSWGYEQTNVDHYQIVKVIGKRTVEVRKLAEHDESTGDMTGRVTPIHGEFAGEVMRRSVDKWGSVNILKANYGRASKIEPLAVVHGVRCYAASSYSSYA